MNACKNSMKNQQQGYIILMSMMLLMIAGIIVFAVSVRGMIFFSFADAVIKRDKAKMLAFSGVQIAISQLADRPNKKEPEAKDVKKEDQKVGGPELLARLLPIINRWQVFTLKESIDGVDGEIRIKIMCEDGKIPLNQIFDFTKFQFKGEKEPKGDWKQFMDIVLNNVQKMMGASDLQNQLVSYFKKEKKPLLDITQLLLVPGWQVFNAYQFSRLEKNKSLAPLILTDLFTTWSEKATIEPWLMSDALLRVLNLKVPSAEERTKQAQSWVKNYKPSLKFPEDWKTIFMPMYENDWQSLPKASDSFFSTTFDPTYFSVVSYGKIGAVSQSIYLILERVKRVVKGKTINYFIIRKAY